MLTFENITLKSANLGESSLIPDIKSDDANPFFRLDETIPENHGLRIGDGLIPSVFPYKMQSLYDRNFKDTPYKAAILENECLKAVFLPELGGRLFSLYDKKRGLDLVYKNDVVCFANLALRNVWFAGGVEWNIGIKGHSPLTCDTLFAAKEKNKNGEDVLKMFAYEECRGLVYVIRATLDGEKLLVNVTVENPCDCETWMYWWSNIAVAQTKNTRAFVPTNKSFITSYRDGGYIVSHMDVPMVDGVDISYAVNSPCAKDYFFDIPGDNKKWIASVEADGMGLLHFSDKRLIGRKMFVWGSTQGGSHWNSWLTEGRDYYEIQAGLMKTQFEHFPIAAHEIISWTECYTCAHITPEQAKGNFATTSKIIDDMVDESVLQGNHFVIAESNSPVIYGSGSAVLAKMLKKDKMNVSICDFPPDSLEKDSEKRYFSDILSGKANRKPIGISYVSDREWIGVLEALENKSGYDFYQLGLVYFACGMIEKATQNLGIAANDEEIGYLANASLALVCANFKHDENSAFEYALAAIKANKNYLPLDILFGELCIKAEKYAEFAEFCESSRHAGDCGRIKMYFAKCLSELGKLDEAKKLLSDNLVVPDIREGEYSLFHIWVGLHAKIIARDTNKRESDISIEQVLEKYPIPAELDFRMH